MLRSVISFLCMFIAIVAYGVDFSDVTDIAGVGCTGSSRGVAWGDYDNDGDLDLYVANYNEANVLYRNNGDGTFTDVTSEAGVGCISHSYGVAWGDYDNDGDLDLYVANYGANVLYRNNGDGTFTDVTSEAGVSCTGSSLGVAWGDYDNDGDLDLYVANHYEANVLYKNNGDGTFTDVTGAAGVGCTGSSYGVAWGDYDNDGDLDLYVTNYEANVLYRNNGDGTFTDVTSEAGVSCTGSSRGVAWGDYDNDGDLDLYVANYNEANVLYRNNGDGTFTDVTSEAGVGCTGHSLGVAWGDYDNDGDLDLYVTNDGANVLYRNNGDGTFTMVGAGVGCTGSSYGVAWGDYDNDGHLDLYVANSGANVLYRNNGNLNHWLQIRLHGTISNRSAIGTKVKVIAH